MENLYKDITELDINKRIAEQLQQNDINNVYELCHYSRMELGDLGLENNDINRIIIAVQLVGFNLKPNHARKNLLIDK